MYLESVVCPLCEFSVDANNKAELLRLHGTAFLINRFGSFLTAKHVVDNALAGQKERGTQIGLTMKAENGKSPNSIVVQFNHVAYAPDPFDIAIGQVNSDIEGMILTVAPIEVAPWLDVASYGYPANATTGEPGKLDIATRCLKGYIQRLTRPKDIPFGQHPDGFELSFLVGNGLSGAPVFVRREPRDVAIGVCVGSIRSELIVSSHTDFKDGETTYRETISKIEEYGLAHDLRPLLDWKPEGYQDLTLQQISETSAPPDLKAG